MYICTMKWGSVKEEGVNTHVSAYVSVSECVNASASVNECLSARMSVRECVSACVSAMEYVVSTCGWEVRPPQGVYESE